MALNVIHGVQNAENVLVRIDPLDMDSLPESVLARTEEAFGKGVTPLQSVHQMLDDVKRDGDAAVLRYAKLLDDSDLEDFRVTEDQMAQARDSVSKELRESLELAAQRVRSFHESTMPWPGDLPNAILPHCGGSLPFNEGPGVQPRTLYCGEEVSGDTG
ncbi:MAG: hypothetical protein DSY79_10255, partial [Chloroflexi bacterium]